MSSKPRDVPEVLRIYYQITEYPILCDTIRERMRQEIFRRGIVSRERFEQEARERAILSQRREGINNPYMDEPAEIWERRLKRVRDYLTDSYFAYNMTHRRFEQIVQEVLDQHKSRPDIVPLNAEVADPDALFAQAEEYEALPPSEMTRARHHLQEIKVALIRRMISDQLAFVRVAKEYLGFPDLKWIHARRIGEGKIGGKAAGMVLAWKILQATFAGQGAARTAPNVVLPPSYFIGADVFYEFLALNDLQYYMDQKYKDIHTIEKEFSDLKAAYIRGHFPDLVLARLQSLLDEIGRQPLIVRSSSLLEDNFETSFAGKYDSVFCPNQGDPAENLAALTQAITSVYASVANPNALLYRKQRGLLDFDERMAVLLQVVQGEPYRQFYFPSVAGMAYSRNPFIWNPQLRREDGFLRMVTGLGTRAVERVGEDYPRMVALSHPRLRPESGAQQIRYYSQYFMDVINIEENRFETHRISEVLAGDFPGLRFLASLDKGDYVGPMVFSDPSLNPADLVMTFDGLLAQTRFVEQVRSLLKALEFGYGRPVDIEFTISLGTEYPQPSVELRLLQCRPQSGTDLVEEVQLPQQLPAEDIIFGTAKLVPTGRVRNIAYIVYVDPEKYSEEANPSLKLDLARLIGRINQRLDGQTFILMGPGRWGSSNPDLGLKVGYADIYNSVALVEIGWTTGKGRPTLSYGTHFFQDLVESHIYPLAIYPGEPDNPFQKSFFDQAMNALPTLLPDDARLHEYVKIIHVPAVAGDRVLELVMSGEAAKAVAFLTRPSN